MIAVKTARIQRLESQLASETARADQELAKANQETARADKEKARAEQESLKATNLALQHDELKMSSICRCQPLDLPVQSLTTDEVKIVHAEGFDLGEEHERIKEETCELFKSTSSLDDVKTQISLKIKEFLKLPWNHKLAVFCLQLTDTEQWQAFQNLQKSIVIQLKGEIYLIVQRDPSCEKF